ncbi:MAG: hypothetical protein ACRD99_04075 [Nitrososphaera sp.]
MIADHSYGIKRSKYKSMRRPSAQKKSANGPAAEITIPRSSRRKETSGREKLASTTSGPGVPFLMARDIAKNDKVRIESR